MAWKNRDLNEANIETERWNRMDHILRFITNAQSMIATGDYYQNPPTMYQGLQLLLDTITPDFKEEVPIPPELRQKGERTKKTLRGYQTKKFQELRKLLDQGLQLYTLSMDRTTDYETRRICSNRSYRTMQLLKYRLLQECEILGYNAKKVNTSDAYREGNN